MCVGCGGGGGEATPFVLSMLQISIAVFGNNGRKCMVSFPSFLREI